MIKLILGILLFFVGVLWLGWALYLAWPPLLNIYAAYLIGCLGYCLLKWDDDLKQY